MGEVRGEEIEKGRANMRSTIGRGNKRRLSRVSEEMASTRII